MYTSEFEKQKKDNLAVSNANIKQLRKLTEKLPVFHDMIDKTSPGYTQLKMDKGVGLGFSLLSQKEISVAKWFSSAGSVFPRHTHNQREFVIVYEGKMILTNASEGELILTPGSFAINEPGEEHFATFEEDTWYMAITVPNNPDWPS